MVRSIPIVKLMPVAVGLATGIVLETVVPFVVVPPLPPSVDEARIACSQYPLTLVSVVVAYDTETVTGIAAPVLVRLRTWKLLQDALLIWIVLTVPKTGLMTILCAFAQIGAANSSAVATTKRRVFLTELYAASMICLGSSMITDHKLCLPIN